jgi:glyoxylase-like metal-dependent hydrolase (beta-lactamase superfamily II)
MEIQNNIFMLDASPQSHVFLIRGSENILIDTGFPGAGKKILSELKSIGADPKSIRHILLTHHDIDHIGHVKMLSEITGAQVWASAEDIPYIVREKTRPGIKRLIGILMRAGIPEAIHHYAPGQHFADLEVIPAPGHTPGHVIAALNDVIFAGDLIKIRNGAPEPMPRSMNWDNAKARDSIALLKNREFRWICPSHGHPVPADDAILNFISSF